MLGYNIRASYSVKRCVALGGTFSCFIHKLINRVAPPPINLMSTQPPSSGCHYQSEKGTGSSVHSPSMLACTRRFSF